MPAVLEERPFGGFFMFFAKMVAKIFMSHLANIFMLSYHRLRADPLSFKIAGITGRR
nr:MAG TPA: hypothetical protein [Caudoviricetes sp.]